MPARRPGVPPSVHGSARPVQAPRRPHPSPDRAGVRAAVFSAPARTAAHPTNPMNPWTKPGLVLLVLALLLPMPASAYSLTPSLLMLSPTGSGSSAFLRLANREMLPVAVELTINEHQKDLAGQPVTGPAADNDFLIYPAQLVLMPGDEVAVQVRWISESILPTERVYTLVARQVPIPQAAAQEPEATEGIRLNVRVLLNYEARIYVTPPGAKPNVTVESASESPPPPGDGPGAAGSDRIEVTLVNQGTAHKSLRTHSLIIVPLDSAGIPLRQPAVTVPAKDVPGLTPHLLAGDRRRLLIPRPAGLPAGPVRVILSE